MRIRTAGLALKPLFALALVLAAEAATAEKTQPRKTPTGGTAAQSAVNTTANSGVTTDAPKEENRSTFDAQDAIRGGRTENQQSTGESGSSGLPAGAGLGNGSRADQGGVRQNNGGEGSNADFLDSLGDAIVGVGDQVVDGAAAVYEYATRPDNGTSSDGTRYVDGKPANGYIKNEGTYKDGHLIRDKNGNPVQQFTKGSGKGGNAGTPAVDEGNNGPGGTSGANGGTVNTAGGTRGPTDDGGRGGTGGDGVGSNAAGRSFNGGGRGGSDDPLDRGDEGGGALNRNRVNPGNSDPLPDGSNSPRSYSNPAPASAGSNAPVLLTANSDAGRFGTRYRLNKASPFAVQVDRAEYSLDSLFIGNANSIDGEISANRSRKLLYVYGTLTNTGATTEDYNYLHIDWAAMGGDEIEAARAWDYPVRLDAKSGARLNLVGRLAAGASIPVVWAVALPPEGAARSFVFIDREGLRLGYALNDGKNRVAPLPAPYASPQDGATVANPIAASIGTTYAGPSFDVTVQSGGTLQQVLGETAGDRQQWQVVNVLVRNHRLNVQDINDFTFTPVLRTAAGGEIALYTVLDGKQDVAASSLPKLMMGASRNLRFVFRVPVDDAVSTFVWSECASQPCGHPLDFNLH